MFAIAPESEVSMPNRLSPFFRIALTGGLWVSGGIGGCFVPAHRGTDRRDVPFAPPLTHDSSPLWWVVAFGSGYAGRMFNSPKDEGNVALLTISPALRL